MYIAFGEQVHVYLYTPFLCVVSGLVLLRLQSMSFSLGADVNVVLMPALARERLICGAISGM